MLNYLMNSPVSRLNHFLRTDVTVAEHQPNQAENGNAEGDSSNSIFVEEMMREQNPIRVKESSRKLFTDKERSNVSQ